MGCNRASGVISGTPTVAGTFIFSIKVTDVNGKTGVTAFQIVIATSGGGGGGGGAFTFMA